LFRCKLGRSTMPEHSKRSARPSLPNSQRITSSTHCKLSTRSSSAGKLSCNWLTCARMPASLHVSRQQLAEWTTWLTSGPLITCRQPLTVTSSKRAYSKKSRLSSARTDQTTLDGCPTFTCTLKATSSSVNLTRLLLILS
jgi:hypothetical protein